MRFSTLLLSFVASSLAAPSAELTERQDDDDFYTRLVYWNKCSASQKKAIQDGWKSIQPVQEYFAKNDIDFNSAAALEYLGPPAFNKGYQSRMQEIIKQHATIQGGWTDWFSWKIHIRCDDPSNMCKKCGDTGPWAYTSNKDSDSKLARINFCPRYFNSPNLEDQIAHGKSANFQTKANMNTYAYSKGWVWFHEILHIDWATKAKDVLAHVTDIRFGMLDEDGQPISGASTGPWKNKVLARNAQDPGFWTSRNADSLTCFAISRYVQSQIGNIYPHLPLAPLQTITPRGFTETDGGQSLDIANDGTVVYNSSAPDTTQVSDSCFVDDESGSGETAEIKKFSTEDNYPDEYKKQWKQWVEELGGSTGDNSGGSNSGDTKPIPDDQQPTCSGTNLNGNFPTSWTTTDGQASAIELLYRMRDQACQGKCENVKGVPGNSGNPSPDGLLAAARQGDKGCEYAVKIAADKELYLYATSDGSNCYAATERAMNTCIKDRKNDAGWVNGPNYGEFYQVGVRNLNGNGSNHGKFPDNEKNTHLGYKQAACQRTDNGAALWYEFKVEIAEWDDGQYGRTIRDKAKKCGLVTNWKYEDEPSWAFADGRKADKYAIFRLPYLVSDRCGEKAIESALGLQGNSVTCKKGEWSEVSMF